LYPLPGVKPLLDQAQRKLNESSNNNSSSTNNNHNNMSNSTQQQSATDANGRSYTQAQVEIVNTVLKARQSGGRHLHYRILGLDPTADESAIKKSYRKLALKLHPDKNSAPHADEAFKAVGLAYATLSDVQKRSIYDRYGEEDPDQRGGGMRGGHRGAHFHGQDVSPEDIFNMFFGGMQPGAAGGGFGGPGVRVYSTGFGPGFAFGGMNHPNMARQRAQQQQQQQDSGLLGQLLQFLPLMMILFLSFFNMPGDTTGVGGSKYFSLTVSLFTCFFSGYLSYQKSHPFCSSMN
jgi:curved DNA-binding protein CbpA